MCYSILIGWIINVVVFQKSEWSKGQTGAISFQFLTFSQASFYIYSMDYFKGSENAENVEIWFFVWGYRCTLALRTKERRRMPWAHRLFRWVAISLSRLLNKQNCCVCVEKSIQAQFLSSWKALRGQWSDVVYWKVRLLCFTFLIMSLWPGSPTTGCFAILRFHVSDIALHQSYFSRMVPNSTSPIQSGSIQTWSIQTKGCEGADRYQDLHACQTDTCVLLLWIKISELTSNNDESTLKRFLKNVKTCLGFLARQKMIVLDTC